jgi:hypothetical protein
MKPITISDQVYKADILIIPKYKPQEIIKYFRKTYGIEYEIDSFCDAMHYSLSQQDKGIIHHYLIFENFRNSPAGIALLSHEIFHLVCAIFRDIGMKFSEDSEEAFTYYLQYLTENILNKLIK